MLSFFSIFSFQVHPAFLLPGLASMEQEFELQDSLIAVQRSHTEPMTQTGGSMGAHHSIQPIFQISMGFGVVLTP